MTLSDLDAARAALAIARLAFLTRRQHVRFGGRGTPAPAFLAAAGELAQAVAAAEDSASPEARAAALARVRQAIRVLQPLLGPVDSVHGMLSQAVRVLEGRAIGGPPYSGR